MMAIIVDARDEAAIRFFERFGFELLTHTKRRMFLPLRTVQALLEG